MSHSPVHIRACRPGPAALLWKNIVPFLDKHLRK